MVGNVESIRETFPGIYTDAHTEGRTSYAVIFHPAGRPDEGEEITVEAQSERHAKEIAEIVLDEQYTSPTFGFTIASVVQI